MYLPPANFQQFTINDYDSVTVLVMTFFTVGFQPEGPLNFAGSSPAMECEGAVVLWERSPEHHNRDGDSKAFNSIKNVYGAIKVEKLDCVEHVQEKNIS